MSENKKHSTNENKKTGSQVKKPTVTKTTVTKNSQKGQSGSKTGTSKRHTSNGTKASTATNRTSAGKTSASNNRTSTTRNNTNTNKNRTGATKSNHSSNQRRKKKRGLSGAQKSLIAALVFGVFMAIIITCIMRGSLLSTTQIAGEFYLGTNFDINNYVETKNEKAYLIFDNTSFQPDGIGDYKVEYTVQCGKIKTKKKVTIHVADADTPMITGPDEITVLIGEEIRWADYYQVIDSQQGLEESIVSSNTIDTSQTGIQATTLRVVDWYNNSSTKDITVVIRDLQGKYYYAAKAARQYKIDLGISTKASELYVYTSEENITYVLIGTDSVYTINEDGACSAYEYDIDSETETAAFEDLITSIITDGESVNVFSISDFI